MQTVIDIRMMTAADIPAVLEIQAVCYAEQLRDLGLGRASLVEYMVLVTRTT